VEGALKPATDRAQRGVRGEAPQALPVEGALKPATDRAQRGVRGEAPQALPVEGALSPINCAPQARMSVAERSKEQVLRSSQENLALVR
jgi:hypothetical protein